MKFLRDKDFEQAEIRAVRKFCDEFDAVVGSGSTGLSADQANIVKDWIKRAFHEACAFGVMQYDQYLKKADCKEVPHLPKSVSESETREVRKLALQLAGQRQPTTVDFHIDLASQFEKYIMGTAQ